MQQMLIIRNRRFFVTIMNNETVQLIKQDRNKTNVSNSLAVMLNVLGIEQITERLTRHNTHA